MFDPATLQAGTASASRLADQTPAPRAAEALALVHGCKQVLAAHNRGATPYTELVLWMHDETNPGVIDASEVAVLCHSRLFRTITVYGLASSTPEGLMRLSVTVPETTFDDPSFCDQWRSMPQIRPLTIATGISDMRLEPLSEAGGAASGNHGHVGPHSELSTFGRPMRLRLRWTGDSTDGPQETTSMIAVGTRPGRAQE